jgi:aminoglycoside phosphotransferase (APT) family kinase protein
LGETAQLGAALGRGKMAEVFAYGERVAKLYEPGAPTSLAFREALNLALVGDLGLPAPAVHEVRRFGERWGLVMDRADGIAFGDAAQADPARLAVYLEAMVRLHLEIHALPALHFRSLRDRLAVNIGRAAALGPARQRRLAEALAGLPDGDRLCHGDFHPFNIIGPPGAALVIDWLDATSGPPAADVCRSYVLLTPHLPELAERYVDAYAEAAAMPIAQIMAWLPVTAAARIAEDVPDEVDVLMAMADGG